MTPIPVSNPKLAMMNTTLTNQANKNGSGAGLTGAIAGDNLGKSNSSRFVTELRKYDARQPKALFNQFSVTAATTLSRAEDDSRGSPAALVDF